MLKISVWTQWNNNMEWYRPNENPQPKLCDTASLLYVHLLNNTYEWKRNWQNSLFLIYVTHGIIYLYIMKLRFPLKHFSHSAFRIVKMTQGLPSLVNKVFVLCLHAWYRTAQAKKEVAYGDRLRLSPANSSVGWAQDRLAILRTSLLRPVLAPNFLALSKLCLFSLCISVKAWTVWHHRESNMTSLVY